MNDFDLIDIHVNDPFREQGVIYIGQYGTSGYAVAAKGYICDFIMKGIPISWKPLKFDDSDLSDTNYYNILAKSVMNKNLSTVGSVIMHCTADLWPTYRNQSPDLFSYNRNVIGYTVWETNRLPDTWVPAINDSVNEVWCPSSFNKEVFELSGVTIPIRIVPHIFMKQELPNKNFVSFISSGNEDIKFEDNFYTFYNISEMNERKNISGLIHAYCKTFTKKDPVRLILKVHYKNYSINGLKYCISKIKHILSDYPNHAQILLLTSNLSDLDILGLHSIGDCYISLTRGEAYGLTIADAFYYGKKVITTGFGGPLDYLGKDYSGLVSYEMEDIKNMNSFSHGYYIQGNQQWANPNIDHVVELLKKTVNL